MVDFSFTEEQELIRRAVHEWCQKNLPLMKAREIDEKGEIPNDVIKGLADLNLLLMTVPEKHGGTGADWITTCLVAEELGYADMSIAVPVFFLVASSWGFVVDRYCSEKVRDEFVKKAIEGEGFIGIATTEASGGSDVANIKSTAKKEGDRWILDGEKLYTSGTDEAKRLGGGYFVLVRTSPPPKDKHHLGMTAFFLPADTPELEMVKRFDDMGRAGISTGGFVMNNVPLRDYHKIGEEGKGFYLTMEGFDAARLLIGATCLGAAKRAQEIGMEYIKERKAFGRPIAKFEGIQFELADDWAELEALRSLLYHTAWMMDKKYVEGKFSTRTVSKYVSACKLKIPSFAFEVFKKVMLWLGAYGYTKECPLEMGLRGIMSYMIGAEGTINVQRIIIARGLLGKHYLPYR